MEDTSNVYFVVNQIELRFQILIDELYYHASNAI